MIFANITALPWVFKEIFVGAFDFKSIFGGFLGSCVMLGIKRGLYSNEAGIGSAPNAAATADVSHPVKQGLVQTLSVFIDTIVICSATAFMCMSSGVEPSAELSGAPYVQAALTETLGAFGPIFITIAMILFAFTTLVGNLYYVDKAIFFIFKKMPSKTFMRIYYVVASLIILLVAWGKKAVLISSGDIPQPLSVTRIYEIPPFLISIIILVAPASTEFSTNSLITDAGRSTTSPAAILFAISVVRILIFFIFYQPLF
jgi:AGCS family alanine or glycine:cation symporter